MWFWSIFKTKGEQHIRNTPRQDQKFNQRHTRTATLMSSSTSFVLLLPRRSLARNVRPPKPRHQPKQPKNSNTHLASADLLRPLSPKKLILSRHEIPRLLHIKNAKSRVLLLFRFQFHSIELFTCGLEVMWDTSHEYHQHQTLSRYKFRPCLRWTIRLLGYTSLGIALR